MVGFLRLGVGDIEVVKSPRLREWGGRKLEFRYGLTLLGFETSFLGFEYSIHRWRMVIKIS